MHLQAGGRRALALHLRSQTCVGAYHLTAGKEDAAAISRQVEDASAGLRLLYVTPEKIVNSKRFFAKVS